MQEDDRLTLSLGSIHDGFIWAHKQSNMAAHWEFVRANCSGVLCLDAVHDSGRPILVATAPLGNLTGSCNLLEQNDPDHLAAFWQALKDRGRDAQVIMTDGSPLSKEALQRYGYDVEPQLGIFHVLKEGNKLRLAGGRAIKNRSKRQGNTGRKKRRGRPTKQVHQPRQHRRGLRKQAHASFSWEPQYLIVRQQADLSAQDKADLALLLQLAPALTLLRQCNQPLYRLFAKGMPKPCARLRRTRMVNNPLDQARAFLAKALKKSGKDTLDKMRGLLGWEQGQRTNHHVERNNRGFRLLQKTRDKRRKTHTIEPALELALYARMVEHPFYRHKVRA